MNYSDSNNFQQEKLVQIPDELLLLKIESGLATEKEIDTYHSALYNILFERPYPELLMGYETIKQHYKRVGEVLFSQGQRYFLTPEEFEEPQSKGENNNGSIISTNNNGTVGGFKFFKRQPKTLDELKEEIINAATSSNPKLALTQVAAVNGIPFELAQSIAVSLLKDDGLIQKHDLEKRDYQSCIEQMRDLELLVDPGEKAWKLQELARRYRRTEAQLREAFNHSLIVQHCSEPMSLKELEEKYGAAQTWLLRGWLPSASLTAFYGLGGTGKTLFIQHLLKCLVLGQNWGQYKVTKPLKILYIQTDTSPGYLLENLRQLGIADAPNLQFHTDWSIEYIAQLYQWVKRFGIEMVVIDSISSVSRNSVIHENDMQYARPILQMADIRRELGTSFFLIHHANSAGEMRGSKAIKNSVDEVWKLENPTKGDVSAISRVLTIEKSRSRMPMKYLLEFNDYDYTWQNLGSADTKEGDKEDNRSKTAILRLLEQDPEIKWCAEPMSEELNISINTIRKELSNLWREGLVSRSENPKYRQGGGEPKHFYHL